MSLADFIATHGPALERDEVRNNLILGVLAGAVRTGAPILTWTLGAPGACAIKWPGRPIILGDVTRDQCRALAEATHDHEGAGAVGLEQRPLWFVERARELGVAFADPIPQRIHVLRAPRIPVVQGSARVVTAGDAGLLADWLEAFGREAVPDDPPASRAALEKVAGEGRHLLWIADGGRPVSVAGVARRLTTAAAIAPVYTPPEQRGRGYGAAVTAALAARLLADGKAAVCLYTDLRNAASNRCYAKIGFTGVCDAFVYHRLPSAQGPPASAS
jgi:RimJ/RimL family protein N-acetyltransferase